MSTLKQIKTRVVTFLSALGIDENEAQAEANLLGEEISGLKPAAQILNQDVKLEAKDIAFVEAVLAQRRRRMPLQYCLGFAYFMGMKLKVRPGVFIPRHDTEILVDVCHKLIKEKHSRHIFEIGVGSGAVSLALLRLNPQLTASGCDCLPKALETTKQNAHELGLADRLHLSLGSWPELLSGVFDALVSNPPYIKPGTTLDPEVADWEPHQALFGDDQDGLGFYRQFALEAKKHLSPNGFAALEFGDGQANDVRKIFAESGWQDIAIFPDLNGKDRVLAACPGKR